jgi:hypothetical protein
MSNHEKFKILLLDDDEAIQAIAPSIENAFPTAEIYQAKDFFIANDILADDPGMKEIDLIITDLFISPSRDDGFSDNDYVHVKKASTGKFLLYGWVWLKNYVLARGFPAKKVIVLSFYLRELADAERAKYPTEIKFVNKDEGFDKLKAAIQDKIDLKNLTR